MLSSCMTCHYHSTLLFPCEFRISYFTYEKNLYFPFQCQKPPKCSGFSRLFSSNKVHKIFFAVLEILVVFLNFFPVSDTKRTSSHFNFLML